MSDRRRLWIHCTQDFHGEVWEARRRTPTSIGEKEPRTPRLCVASSVARCLTAKFFPGLRDVLVYRTETERSAIPARRDLVWDAAITQEHWIFPPVRLVLAGVVPIYSVQIAQAYAAKLVEKNGCGTHAGAILCLRDVLQMLKEMEKPDIGVPWYEASDLRFVELFTKSDVWPQLLAEAEKNL